MEGVYSLPIFADATDDEVQWLIDHSREMTLEAGEYYWHEGDPARHFFVVLEGELLVTRTINGEQIVQGTAPRGIMGGETFLLTGGRATASACAILPTRLMVFDLPAFLAIFTHVPSVGVKILRTAAERMQNYATLVKHQEKMAALGKLAAGLAHELNNPAAAATRSVAALQTLMPSLQAHAVRLNALGLTAPQLESVLDFLVRVIARGRQAAPLSTLEQSAAEDELGDWLEEMGGRDPWEMAATLVHAQVTVDDLAEFVALAPAGQVQALLDWLHESLAVMALLDEVGQSTRRISELVTAIKSYTYMDRGVMQEVDIHRDLENTLLMLKHRLRDIQVIRTYDPNLPHLLGRGGELNQVWTNLIDNAVDALDGAGDATIRLITRCENSYAMVEVADNGAGIPPEVQARIFEPFFTTKEVGAGTGLGLDIVYRIVQQHNGTIEVQSQPGKTRFIVRLPVELPVEPAVEPGNTTLPTEGERT
jgi:signal transduction histidine kinase